MKLMRALQCLIQQFHPHGVRVASRSPLTVEGLREEVEEFCAIIAWFKEFCSGTFDSEFRTALDSLEGYVFTIWERQLVESIGSFVDTNDGVFLFGRLEGVIPGTAWVTPRANPNLPACAVAAFRERMRGALPFSSLVVVPNRGSDDV